MFGVSSFGSFEASVLFETTPMLNGSEQRRCSTVQQLRLVKVAKM